MNMFILSLGILLPYIALFAILLIVERQCIKKRKKWEWVIPVLVTVLCIGMAVSGSKIRSCSSGITDVLVWDDSVHIGEVRLAADRDNNLKAIGKLVVGDNEKELDYINLEYRDGELVGSEKALKYKKPIDKAIGFVTKGYTGKSVSYDELEKAREEIRKPVESFSWKLFRKNLLMMFIVPVIFWLMPLLSAWMRKRRNQLNKSKLEDL